MKRLINKIHTLSILKYETFTQAAKYLIVGGFCTVLDFAMLFISTYFARLNYLTSSIISFMSGTVLNYYFSIFKLRVVENLHHEFFYCAIIIATGLGIITLLIWSFAEFIGL